MRFRTIKQRWPQSIKDLVDKSGVYAIRDKDSKRVLYVGESHTNALKKTLTRHFQTWSTRKSKSTLEFLTNFLGFRVGPNKTYDLENVQIAFMVTDKSKAQIKEAEYIEKLDPRDNEYKKFEDDPF